MLFRQTRLFVVDDVGAGPAVVPGVAGVAEGGEGFEGNHPAEAAEEGGPEGDGGAILVNGAGAGDELAEGFAAAEEFDEGKEEEIQHDDHEIQLEIDRGERIRFGDHEQDEPSADGAEEYLPEDVDEHTVDDIVAEAFAAAGLNKIDVFVVKEVDRLVRGRVGVFHSI